MSVIHMECLSGMRMLPDNFVDSVVCDPPYGLSFMGKRWDYDVPSVDEWREALRLLKPGGYLLAFGGTRTYHRLVCGIEDAGFEIRDQIGWAFGSGFPKSHNGEWGGTALKPAWEPICMARKPLEGTVEANWRKWGTGALAIDACRVETDEPLGGGAYAKEPTERGQMWGADAGNSWVRGGAGEFVQPAGRWPANLIHDGSDEVLAAFPEAPGQMAKASTSDTQRAGQNTYGNMMRGSNGSEPRIDSGSAARFFYCAKASKSDRGEGNAHPTVKPTALMRYLCRLVTPAAGLVLDPWSGSGSTGKAAVLEGFGFIGFERDAEHVAIANARITHARGAV
jgi:DNA modification methylase